MRFGFLLKRGHEAAARVAGELAAALRQRGLSAVVTDDDRAAVAGVETVAPDALGAAIDVLVVLGGDGTLLRGAALVAEHGVPLLGINLGGLGFMAPYAVAEARAALEAVCDRRLPIEERMRLAVTVREGDREGETRVAVNEAVVAQRGIARLLDLDVELDGSRVTEYKADGLIVATPTGSTAYSLASGGPILTPDLAAIVLTPICPHAFTHRPVVVRPDAHVSVKNASQMPATLTIDGQWTRELAPGHAIAVRRAAKPLLLYRPPQPFFAILRQKLSWGER